ncbi:MAG: nucleotide exchange factor GrpE [Planctomycetota bacterium]|jgi:molecular chaperone GrpE
MNSASNPSGELPDSIEDANEAFFAEQGGDRTGRQEESPERLVDALEQQVVDLRQRELKAQAELENFRKRMVRETESQIKFASLPLVRDLLDVVDNLHRAIESSAASAGSEGLVEGVRMVQQQLVAVLEKHSCKPIESLGKTFDPNVHQAIAQQPSPEFPAGTVLQEVSVGYRMHDRVVRPSMVIVSTGPS